eukprot:TRINITY_DN30292_c1_g1_i1.p1 TRINITY_DN30292_c1_g1~~TRINITY_DN30292_c1_g1_i1.p1  ORF type:complete len:216 (-),score=-16.50 TRINITY_DN30292_c1_g1_i1:25-672(-)
MTKKYFKVFLANFFGRKNSCYLRKFSKNSYRKIQKILYRKLEKIFLLIQFFYRIHNLNLSISQIRANLPTTDNITYYYYQQQSQSRVRNTKYTYLYLAFYVYIHFCKVCQIQSFRCQCTSTSIIDVDNVKVCYNLKVSYKCSHHKMFSQMFLSCIFKTTVNVKFVKYKVLDVNAHQLLQLTLITQKFVTTQKFLISVVIIRCFPKCFCRAFSKQL